jgi:type I restriction enzyme R subunit
MFTEKEAVEDYIVNRLQEMEWEFKEAPELKMVRGSYEEPLLIKNLEMAIRRINKVNISDEDVNYVISQLKNQSGIEGAKRVLDYLKNGISVRLEKENRLERIQLFDFENPENNEFIVTRQIIYRGRSEIRPDVVLYINGIPLVVIECKNPVDPDVSWYDAYKQVKDYEKAVPELFKYVQFSIATGDKTKYFPNVSWLEDVATMEWRIEGIEDDLEATLQMLSKDVLLDIIGNYIFYREEKGVTSKVIARYMQYRAARKIVDRVISTIKGEEDKKSGLIWHWQGSGKTLTMIFAAYQLYRHKLLRNPTIFFIVDRQELEEQLSSEFAALGMGRLAERITSIQKLIEVLTHDSGKGRRGIFITLIQKFRQKELRELKEALEKIEGDDTILTRENVIAFVDEGHRSQYGSLASTMRSILRNAFFFAFTGTPIAKYGRDTYREFSPEDEKYLDRYFILDSIRDGFTVRIDYQPRLEERVHLKKELLRAFLEEAFEELPEEYRDIVEERVKRRIDAIKAYLKNPKRIEIVAKDIADHYLAEVDGKFKAMIVAADREACVDYKRALDRHLPKEYSEIVMTFNRDDEEKIKEYQEELKERYGDKDVEDIRKEIVEKFKNEEYPKILIVTDMLLTGFDAPILQVMYLDKPIKEHRLLQAIARTNRPYEGKDYGLIIDYVGIFSELEKAFAIYSADDVEGAAFSIDDETNEFEALLEEALSFFAGIERRGDRQTLMMAVRKLMEGNNGNKFERIYKALRSKFELLGAHPIKAEHLDDFKWLTRVYYAYYRKVRKVDPEEVEKYVRKYYRKTLEFIYKTVEIGEIRRDFPIIPIDEDYLKKIEKLYPNLEDRVSEIIISLRRFILVNKKQNPYYETLADRIEKIIQKWKERKESLERIYREAEDVIDSYNRMRRKQRELGLSSLEFFILLTIQDYVEKDEKELIGDVKEIIRAVQEEGKIFPGWTNQPSAVKEVERVVRRAIRRKYRLEFEKRDELHEKLMKILTRYDK